MSPERLRDLNTFPEKMTLSEACVLLKMAETKTQREIARLMFGSENQLLLSRAMARAEQLWNL